MPGIEGTTAFGSVVDWIAGWAGTVALVLVPMWVFGGLYLRWGLGDWDAA